MVAWLDGLRAREPSKQADAPARDRILARQLAAAAAAFDEARRAAAETAAAAAVAAVPPPPPVDLDLVEFLQPLLGEIRRLRSDRPLSVREAQVAHLIKRSQMRAIWPSDPEAAADPDWFELVFDPRQTERLAEFPAILGQDGLVLQGRIRVPAKGEETQP